jgi:hypothetical protein
MKFKEASIYIKEDYMNFFIQQIVEKIFTEFIKSRNYEPIFQLVKILQFMNIYINSNVLNSSHTSNQFNQLNNNVDDVNYNILSSQDFKVWIENKNNIIRHALSYKKFWIYSLSQIFAKLSNMEPPSKQEISPSQKYVPNKSNFVNNHQGHFPGTMSKPRQMVNRYNMHQLQPNMVKLNKKTSNDNIQSQNGNLSRNGS